MGNIFQDETDKGNVLKHISHKRMADIFNIQAEKLTSNAKIYTIRI